MRKRYNVFIISRLYLRNFYKYLITMTNIRGSQDAYGLFIYSIKKMYGLDTIEFSASIEKYGEECINYLNSIPNTPKNKKKVSYEDKVRVVSVCEGYAKATSLLSYNVINNGRVLKENYRG